MKLDAAILLSFALGTAACAPSAAHGDAVASVTSPSAEAASAPGEIAPDAPDAAKPGPRRPIGPGYCPPCGMG